MNTEINLDEFRDLLEARRDQLKMREREVGDLRDVPDLDEYGYDAGDRTVQEDDKIRAVRDHATQLDELRAVDAALFRVAEGSYGQCLICGENILPNRLRALPHTYLCAACAEQQEEGLGRGAYVG